MKIHHLHVVPKGDRVLGDKEITKQDLLEELVRLRREIEVLQHTKSLNLDAALFPEENPSPVLRVGCDYILLYANRPAVRLLEQWQCEVGSQVPVFLQQAIQTVVESGSKQELEIRSGNRELSFDLIPVAGRNYVNLYGRDVTDHKQRQESLRASEEKYRLLFETSRDAIMTLAPPSWKFTTGNPAAIRMFRARDEADFISRLPWEYAPERQSDNTLSADKARELIETAMREGSLRFEWSHQRLDGETFPATVLLTRFELGGQTLLQASVRDITERKRAEAAICENEDRLRFALETSHTGAWDLDLVDHTAFRSLEHDRIFGYTELLPEWTYEIFLEHVLPEDRSAVDTKFRHAIERQRNWNFECRIRRADNEIRWIWAAGQLRPNATGVPRKMAGIVQDITERKRLEKKILKDNIELEERVKQRTQEVLKERQRLYEVLETLPVMLCLLTPEHHVPFSNRAFRKMFGEPGDRHCYEFRFGRTEPCDSCETYRVLETGSPHHWEGAGPGGTVIDVYDYPFTDWDGSPLILEMALDITDQRRSEEQLRRTQFVVETTADGVYWVGADARISSVNDAACKILGYTRDELLSMSVFDISPDFSPAIWPNHWEEVRKHKSFTFETSGKAKDGRIFPVEVMINYAQFGDNEYNCAFVRDITERKQAEEKLKHSLSLLQATLQSTADGILVIANDGRITGFNEQFVDLWGIPRSILAQHDDQQALDLALKKVQDPEQFLARVKELYANPAVTSIDVLNLMDGRVVERYSQAQIIDGKPVGRVWSFRDVTEQRRVEQNLRASEEKFRAITTVATDAIILIDDVGRITYWNLAAERIFGYSEAEALGRDLHLLLAPVRYSEAFQRGFSQFVQTGLGPVVGKTVELGALKSDGSEFPMEISISALCLGGCWHALGVIRDITDRKAGEAALRESEERFRSLFETAQVVNLIVDPAEGAVIDVNAFASRFYGWSRDELLTMKTTDLTTLSREDVLEKMEAARAKERSYFQVPNLLADGSVREVEIYSGPISIGGKKLIYAIIHDVTDRKLAEEALRASEEQVTRLAQELKTILDTLTVGVSFVINRKVQWGNPALNHLFGYGPAEIIGLDASEFYADENGYTSVGSEGYAQLTKGQAYSTEVKMKRQDGTSFWCSMIGRAVNPDNLAEGTIWMLQDITDRKQAEAALLEKTSQLEGMTKELERRVQEEVERRLSNEQMLLQQSKLAAMGEMLGAISHQWRQPLNALGVIIQNIQESYTFGEMNKESLERSVQRSMTQIQHMSKTIDDFRNFFKPDKEKTEFDTMRAIGDVLSLTSAQLSANGISYRLTCHTHGKTFENEADIVCCPEKEIVGYRNEFEHVILNLINNARDAIVTKQHKDMPHSSVPGHIDFDFYRTDTALVIKVADNGGGIDIGISDRIFEPYFTTKDPAKGTGLGLYMSKAIMEHMGGSLSVKNSDQGAVFVLELPLASTAGGTAETTARS